MRPLLIPLLVLVSLHAAPLHAQAADENPLGEPASEPLPSQPSKAPPHPVIAVRAAEVLDQTEFHRWDRHIRGFRRDHNFALSAGVSSGTWRVKRFGTLEDKKYDDSGVWTKFQYTFHLQIYKGFGYLLGSSVGYHYESVDKRREFKPVPAYQFPGVMAGLVMNINPVFRFTTAMDIYLERHNGIEERDGVGDDPEIFVTLQAFDAMATIDVFYDLNWALRLEGHKRHLNYQKPNRNKDDNASFAVDANLKKDDQWVGLGLVYHLL